MNSVGLDVSVVIPCFRSGPALSELVPRLEDSLMALGGVSEILLVDDASGDGTWDRIAGLAERFPRVWGIGLETRVGQHPATLAGLEQSLGDIAVTMDDDLEHRPEDVPRLVGALRSRPDIDCVMAGFPVEHRPALRRAASVVMDRIYRLRYGGPGNLQMTPFRAMTRELVLRLVANAGSDPFMPRLLLTTTSRLVNVPVAHESSSVPSRYTTRDLMGFAWNGLGIRTAPNRSRVERPLYRVRSEVGRDSTQPRGAKP
jgi:glycosyltransferase involved in cell wall biosynthesis